MELWEEAKALGTHDNFYNLPVCEGLAAGRGCQSALGAVPRGHSHQPQHVCSSPPLSFALGTLPL